MDRKKAYEPGDMVATFTGQAGIVVSEEEYSRIRVRIEQGKRPGHYFAPGCCSHPDYITQIPVLFEDGKYDIMRPMNIRKAMALPGGKKMLIQRMIKDLDQE